MIRDGFQNGSKISAGCVSTTLTKQPACSNFEMTIASVPEKTIDPARFKALQRHSLFDPCIAPLINAQTKSEFHL